MKTRTKVLVVCACISLMVYLGQYLAVSYTYSINIGISKTKIETLYNYFRNISSRSIIPKPVLPQKPTIILWYAKPEYINASNDLQPLPKCNLEKCFMTTNKLFMNRSSVVLFSAKFTGLPWMNNPVPPQRPTSKQIWILHTQEAQRNPYVIKPQFRNPAYRNMFNWTMTYRSDSDIYSPYGIISRKVIAEPQNWSEILQTKENKIVWIVSNCGAISKRNIYVQTMQKYNITVDIYGECSKLKISRNVTHKLMEKLLSKYKFYLSFENNFCVDYVTEKFFLKYNMNFIQVVRGGANYSKIAPHGTYIDTADYKSIKALSDHLKYLMNNDTAYIEILKRKHQYTSYIDRYLTYISGKPYVHSLYEHPAMCEICRRSRNLDKYGKVINRVDLWYDKNACRDPNDLH